MNYLQFSDAPWLTLLVLSPIIGLLLVALAGAMRVDDRVVKMGATAWSLVSLGLAILSSALPYTLEMIAMTRLPARTFGTLLSLEPAFAAMAGMIFLNEHLSMLQWSAIVAIIVASAGTVLSARQVVAEPLMT